MPNIYIKSKISKKEWKFLNSKVKRSYRLKYQIRHNLKTYKLYEVLLNLFLTIKRHLNFVAFISQHKVSFDFSPENWIDVEKQVNYAPISSASSILYQVKNAHENFSFIIIHFLKSLVNITIPTSLCRFRTNKMYPVIIFSGNNSECHKS